MATNRKFFALLSPAGWSSGHLLLLGTVGSPPVAFGADDLTVNLANVSHLT